MKGGIHLTVAPHSIDSGETLGWEVFLWGDDDGKPDTSKALETMVLDGGPEDQEEIADVYARRLDAGVKPENIFQDTIEANRRMMGELVEQVNAQRK